MRERIKAYPGTLTYLDLMRKNKRESVVLMIAMGLLAIVVGAGVGVAITAYAGALEAVVRPLLIGGAVGLVVAVLGALWSWFSGAQAILRMNRAKEITQEMDAELFNVVDEMRIAAGLPMPRVFLVGDSALNAFATGRSPKHGVIAITTGLRSRLSRDELQGVIAHEMAHIRHLDIRFAMLMATMVGLIAVACDGFLHIAFRGAVYGSAGRSRRRGGGAGALIMVAIALVLAIVAPIAARAIQMTYSRKREYLADAGAAELTRNPLGLASALQKLHDDNEPLVDTANRGTAHMYIVNPLKKMRRKRQEADSVFLSHPPIQDRIARLLALTR